MRGLISTLLLAASLASGLAAAQAPAGDAAASAATVSTAPESRPDDTNAQRAVSQPGNNAPLWRAVRNSGEQAGYSSLPGAEQGVLVQRFVQYPGSSLTTAGEAWRQVRNHWILPYGGSLILLAIVTLGLFYWRKGPLGQAVTDTGRRIERFTPVERAAHWLNAGAFVVLALSGIVMAFGKFFLLPILGGTLFGWLTWLLKTAHNFVGPLFAVTLLVIIVTFVKDNFANKSDFVWLSKAGGMLSEAEVPSHRFNAGEKGMFWWGVTIPGLLVVASGLVLDKIVPGLGALRGDMQIAHMVHAAMAMVMMTLLIGHIYMGTVGVRGAYRAMRTGYVDESWAKEHHELWYDDVRDGKIPAQRSTPPVDAASARLPAASPQA
jgi:formate dehydrogenase subunit gamma